ncbi:GlxA family transcriptional regulator [Luedemannella helvata]|uniref:Helix-turn-helix domain-containing protein n=1 Tax=Luedemannella helvata TaxID=349315 RepID=A0ABP4WWY7_9ACTN
MPFPPDNRHKVAVLVLDGVVPLDLGIPAQVFGTARDDAGRRHYAVRTCTPDGGPVRCAGGFSVLPDYGPEILAGADTVVVPGISTENAALFAGGALTDAERAALAVAARAPRLMSICTAAFALAAMGVLDGRPATTHWLHAARFRALFPRVLLDPDVLFVDDGDVLTSAGVAAGLDLCLHVVRRDFGAEVANRAARRCVVQPWRDGGQSQFIERPVPTAAGGATSAAREWARRRLDEPIDLDAMARAARMSVRTFTRRFREETGLSPSQWLLAERVEHARLLLETTDLGVDAVARRAGFGTAVSLRSHLHRTVGVSPAAYRRAFRANGHVTR